MREITVWLPNRAQHIPNPFQSAKGPSFLSRSDRCVIEDTRTAGLAAMLGRDMMRTLMVSTGWLAAEHTKLSGQWGKRGH